MCVDAAMCASVLGWGRGRAGWVHLCARAPCVCICVWSSLCVTACVRAVQCIGECMRACDGAPVYRCVRVCVV